MKNDNTKDLGLALLRIVPSILMMTHGWSKFSKILNGDFTFANPIGIGEAPSLILVAIAEFLCPILVIIGFKTRWAAIPTAITMLVAALIVHASDPFGHKELPLLFLSVFTAIILLGPGKYSIDKK